MTPTGRGSTYQGRKPVQTQPATSHSELLTSAWLKKLALHLDRPEVRLVGATGLFESLSTLDPRFPPFPNVHIRSNGFMVERELLGELLSGIIIRDKLDAYFVESGPA
jgi:hypothetical protein